MKSKKIKDEPSKLDVKYTNCSDAITINSSSLIFGTATSGTFTISSEKKVEDVKFIENEEKNFIEIIYSLIPTYNIHTSFSVNCGNKSMIKERYGVVNGKIQIIKTISGSETSGYYVPPTIEWEE